MVNRWTFLVLNEHASERARQYSLSERQIKAVLAGAVLAVLLLGLGIGAVFARMAESHHAHKLHVENKLLSQQVKQQRVQLDAVNGVLSQLQVRDEAFRLMAGLQPLGPEVYAAGMGGSRGSAESQTIRQIDAELGDMVAANALDLDAITQRVRILRDSWADAVTTLQTKYERFAATPSILPTMGYLSSSFSKQRWHPILEENRAHAGIDIAAPIGTPIHAAARATVAFVGQRGQYGLMVELDHGHGYITRYAHMASASVKVGQVVTRRARIGAVGESGLAIGPHLHYEVLQHGVARNPIGFIFDRGAIPD